MTFDYDSSLMAAEVLSAGTADEMEPVLHRLCQMPDFVKRDEVRGHKLFLKALDDTVPHIARVLRMRDYDAPKSNDNICIIATQFYALGGHTRVAQDISRLSGTGKTTVILTDLYGTQSYRQLVEPNVIAAGFHCRAYLAIKSQSVVDRTVELHNLLHAIRPTRIFLVNHHMDLCAVTATWPFRGVTEFVHHVDSLPCVGATLPYSRHVDLTAAVCEACRGIGHDPILTSMSLPPAGQLPKMAAAPAERLRIATCGHPGKYQHPATHRWSEWAAACLQTPGANITHIGPADAAFQTKLQGELAAAGVDPSRYIFAGETRNLRPELARRGINLYLTSYPDGGLRAMYEAMSLGIPTISPKDPDAPPLVQVSPGLPGWFSVDHPDKIAGAIAEAQAIWPEMQTAQYAQTVEAHIGGFERYVVSPPEALASD